MFVHNVRYGFATNSSSTHSIVLIKKGVRVRDDSEDQEFGWNFFTCASEEAKRQYLGQVVKINLAHLADLEDEDAAIIASKWAGVEVNPSGYIDHQSIIAIPSNVNWGRYHLRRDFFDDLLAFILRKDVAILGGNDNEEDRHPLIRDGKARNVLKRYQWDDEEIGSPVLNLMLESGSKHLRARYDKVGKFWSLFCGRSGTKVRTSFTEDANADKSEVPELVDVKITDYCKQGCYYCYQGSTPKGKHASKELVRNVAYALKELETFEVALGGGESTEHPDLLEIIDDFHHMGIVVNLTTRNEDWVINNLPTIKDKIGGIGLSVDSSHGLLDKLAKLRTHLPNVNCDSGLKLTVQVVVGSCSQYEMEDILETCKTFHLTVLLLGWKNTHRGARARREEVNLITLLDRFWKTHEEKSFWDGPSVSFDTSIVIEMREWLEVNGDRWRFTTREGAHSMYIDCVSETMHKSSYEAEASGAVLNHNQLEMSVNIKNYFSTL
ncbi:radical SAM protein [Candidatus Pacearchaeota archaeon]|nr:radical SAM protein [Candidatus Pacearchaeota archaeon]